MGPGTAWPQHRSSQAGSGSERWVRLRPDRPTSLPHRCGSGALGRSRVVAGAVRALGRQVGTGNSDSVGTGVSTRR